jgi:hypothetical protein
MFLLLVAYARLKICIYALLRIRAQCRLLCPILAAYLFGPRLYQHENGDLRSFGIAIG